MISRESVAKVFIRLRVSADLITWAGLLLSFYTAWLMMEGHFFAAGWVLLLSGLCDLLDGAVARASGKNGPFGGILDSSLDRYGDGAVLAACALYYSELGQMRFVYFSLSAFIGSFAISYVRARAECEMDNCRVGFWERGERLVLLALSLLVNNLGAALLILAIGTHWTVFQRITFAKNQIKNSRPIPFYLRPSPRNSRAYFFKISALFLFLLLYRSFA